MPADMKQSKNTTEKSITDRFLELGRIYSGISGEICRSDIEKPHKALYGLSYPIALGFGLLALCGGAWYGYAFYAGIMGFFALIITTRNERKTRSRKSEVEPGTQPNCAKATPPRTIEDSRPLDY